MRSIVIEPWADDIRADELWVPEYVHDLALEVVKFYDFSVHDIEVMATKPFKGGAIWKIETSKGPKSLKLLHRRPNRSLFSLGAQEYLVDVQGARVPAIVKAKNGENYVEVAGKLWFVAEWITPLEPTTNDLDGAKNLCYALGEFHRLSKGYIPPKNAEIATRVTRWPRKYEKMIVKMDWFRQLLLAYNEMPASELIYNVLDMYEEQARESLQRLQQSSYPELSRLGDWGLAHQDYGWSNAQMGPKGMWVIDLDGVTFDLPMRDLSKLITSVMSGLGEWNAAYLREMVLAYHEANPLTPKMYEILLIDLSLPIEFYKNVKDMVYEPEVFLNEETKETVQSIIELEESKWPVLREVQNDWKGVK